MLKEGDNAPKNIELNDQEGNLIKLDDFKGEKLVVYFYPKDNTPGCTLEAKNFKDSIEDYNKKGIKIIGISADSVKSHKNFVSKYEIPFTLLSDSEKKAAKSFGALEQGKVKRRTWLINENWQIEKAFEKVSPTKHIQELAEFYQLK
ncbi:peroxiredoxin [Promethearchaeum syntrophicum]|uniref:thioredoxin-dependent peroxiredoxin n=1 Tax=Promethearchaeum syntrophicum TaxID=2594042 RepID=A0A5B9DE33_9ARCH|nr:peroxiredoxin [Candidatus Prometheoarchaeum syntrophicum]QEE17352.1 putative peroxiredoxin [Candidatus Prometheoarchaeum syntrophicum]